ncbi:MAG: DUF2634 domain-containing protein [Firmicutes bacterium]|nr:DUF2634 domain-containing protein [Bacillota bacterium]
MGSLYPDIPVSQPATTNTKPITYGKELAFDFAAGDFVMEDGRPKVVEGIEALKVWIEKTIRTARYRFPIYTFQYGCELEDIIGLDIPSPVLESEVTRVIREALIYDNRIKDVRDFIFERGGDWLKVEFTVITFDDNSFKQGVSV